LIVVPTFTVDGRQLSPNQLSEGTFRTIALIFYLLQSDSSLLLLEEPEACVHHGLLRSIMDIIKQESSQRQIIISSHSEHVLEQLEPEQVVLVEKHRARGTVARSVSKALGRADFAALRAYLANFGNLGDYWRERGFSDA
jgi:predicted ATPase